MLLFSSLLSNYLHLEVVLIRIHGVDSTHEGSIETIQTAAEIGNPEDDVESCHAPGPRAVFLFAGIMGKLDCGPNIVVVG